MSQRNVSTLKLGYPEDKALKTWQHPTHADVTCSIVRHGSQGHLCGYARFPKRPVREQGYDGILRYVPVHGGLTYASESDDGSMVYGFDCAHAGDSPPLEFDKYPQYREHNGHVWTEREVEIETERMVLGIFAAVAVEEAFLLAADGEARAEVLDTWHDELRKVGIDFELGDNFGAMIGALGGLRP